MLNMHRIADMLESDSRGAGTLRRYEVGNPAPRARTRIGECAFACNRRARGPAAGSAQPLNHAGRPRAHGCSQGGRRGALVHNPLLGHVRQYLEEGDTGDGITLVFSPHVQAGILGRLAEGLRNRIAVVTTWEPRDLLSGASELSLYPFCRERGIALYALDGLHLSAYSVGLETAVLSTGEATEAGMMPGGNYEAAAFVEYMSAGDRLYFEGLRRRARLVNDAVHEKASEWAAGGGGGPENPGLAAVAGAPDPGAFLSSDLPMTASPGALASAYKRIVSGKDPGGGPRAAACAFHDLANYAIGPGLSKEAFLEELGKRFLAHPLVRLAREELVAPEASFPEALEWIRGRCADVPIPSGRGAPGDVEVFMEWLEELGGGEYEIARGTPPSIRRRQRGAAGAGRAGG